MPARGKVSGGSIIPRHDSTLPAATDKNFERTPHLRVLKQ